MLNRPNDGHNRRYSQPDVEETNRIAAVASELMQGLGDEDLHMDSLGNE
jgi:hypothetical protein